MKHSPYTVEECEKIAQEASLRYVLDTFPGIRRRQHGKGFAYYDENNNKITDETVLKRIRALAIPPAYKNVWICIYPNGHMQATGRDARGRKQYIYHPLWQQVRQEKKFNDMIHFGESLPLIRKKIKAELNKPLQLNKVQVMCAIIYLLDNTCVRIGTPLYARENQSFGATTLRKKHLKIKKDKVILDFMGKNAQFWHVILTDKKIIKLLKKCEEIPGYELFKYKNEQGEINIILSQDINAYLKFLTQFPFTAKDFRTWIACRETLYRLISSNLELTAKEQLKFTIKEVALLLGHTPAICQKSYIHPEIIRWWNEGKLAVWKKKQASIRSKDKLLLQWLKTIKDEK